MHRKCSPAGRSQRDFEAPHRRIRGTLGINQSAAPSCRHAATTAPVACACRRGNRARCLARFKRCTNGIDLPTRQWDRPEEELPPQGHTRGPRDGATDHIVSNVEAGKVELAPERVNPATRSKAESFAMTEMVDFLRYRGQQSVTVASRERGRVMIIMERKAADALHWRAAGSRTL
jgi:hypothetical protein